jgi:DNA mismatch repair protein MutS2
VAEANGILTVQAGGLTVRVARSEVEPASGTTARPGPALSLPAREDAPRELHLLGLTTDEARGAVDRFLDDAVLAGHPEVRLVHGKGTGALRRTVEQCLRTHALVRGFRLAEPAAGGAGVTVATLEPAAAGEPVPRRGARGAPARRVARR